MITNTRLLCGAARSMKYNSIPRSPILHPRILFAIRWSRITRHVRHTFLFFILGDVSCHRSRLATSIGVRPTFVRLLCLFLFPLSLAFPLLLCLDLLREKEHVTRADLAEMLQVLISCGSQSQPRPPLFVLRKRVSWTAGKAERPFLRLRVSVLVHQWLERGLVSTMVLVPLLQALAVLGLGLQQLGQLKGPPSPVLLLVQMSQA